LFFGQLVELGIYCAYTWANQVCTEPHLQHFTCYKQTVPTWRQLSTVGERREEDRTVL